MSESPYLRVNGEMLSSLKGQNVCMLGKFVQLSPDQTCFEMTSPDNKKILVKLRTPIRDMMSDVIEVYGSVDEKGNIICTNYSTFEPASYTNFDMDLYNETVQMIHQLPKHYCQAV